MACLGSPSVLTHACACETHFHVSVVKREVILHCLNIHKSCPRRDDCRYYIKSSKSRSSSSKKQVL